jgi:hypothetical protein
VRLKVLHTLQATLHKQLGTDFQHTHFSSNILVQLLCPLNSDVQFLKIGLTPQSRVLVNPIATSWQELPCMLYTYILWKLKISFCVHKNQLLVCILSLIILDRIDQNYILTTVVHYIFRQFIIWLLCTFNLFIVMYVPFSVFYVLFVCKCVLYCCHWVSTQLWFYTYIYISNIIQCTDDC